MSVSSESLKWIEAAKVLSVDPMAVIRCPSKDDEKLVVFDIEHGSKISRYLVCPKCKSYNVILLIKEPTRKSARLVLNVRDETNYSIDEILGLLDAPQSEKPL